MVLGSKLLEPLEEGGFRALTELAPDFVTLLGASGVIRYVSPAVARVLGYSPAEVVGRAFTEFLHPEDLATARADLTRILGGEEIVRARLRFHHRDGSWRTLETLSRNYSSVPSLTGVLVSTRDITEHVDTERRLREALDEAEDLYNSAPCGYHSLDEDGVFVRVNDTELRWLGYARQELIGEKRVEDLLSPDSRLRYERQVPILKRTGLLQSIDAVFLRKDGSPLTVLLSATAVVDADGRFVASRSIVYDITERKRAEEALRKLNRALLVLSATNQELIHAETESGLLDAACRVLVELGGYRMAWVGIAEKDGIRAVRPVAQFGFEKGYLEAAHITWSDDEHGRGPTGTAVRSGKAQVNQNFISDPAMAPRRDEALGRGYQSSAAIPFRAGSLWYVLSIYAGEPQAFDAEELALLGELANDIGFGISTLRARAEKQRAEETVERLAYFDALTGLPNQIRLFEEADRAIADLRSGTRQPVVLTLIVNGFDGIQAGIGVRETDELLKSIAGRLRHALHEGDTLARIGGDAFAILLRHGDPARSSECARRVEAALLDPFVQAGMSLDIRMSIGAAIAPGHGESAEVLFVRSGIAARQARRSGASYALYSGATVSETPQWLALIGELRKAIEHNQLVLHYQPKVDVAARRISGAEALVRWQHPERGQIPPGEFIQIAEQTGLIKELTYCVLDQAIHQSFAWRKEGFELPIAVNISVQNLADPHFPDRLRKSIAAWGVKPALLQLEITESTLMEQAERTQNLMTGLARDGFKLAIDDFGTGYSSLNYVATLPIDSLKIDRSFVAKVLGSPRTHSVIAATVSMSSALGIRTTAEGVETKEQAEALIAMGCSELQGYFFSHPLEPGRFRQWVLDFTWGRYALREASA